MLCVLFFKQKTAYEMRISDWSSDVCSSDLVADLADVGFGDTALTYTAGALEAPSASRLSLSLPVRAEQYPAVGPGGRWVRSLLPEGRALAWAVQHFGIPEDDRYEIGRAHVRTPVTNAQLVCSLLLAQIKNRV